VALTRLAVKRGVLSSAPIDELGMPSDPYSIEEEDGIVLKKGKAADGSTTKWKRGARLSNEEKAPLLIFYKITRYSRCTGRKKALFHTC
jgi:hypothetical protein